MCLTADGLRQLREIINADQWDECLADVHLPKPSIPSTVISDASGPATRRKRSSTEIEEFTTEGRFCKTRARPATTGLYMVKH